MLSLFADGFITPAMCRDVVLGGTMLMLVALPILAAMFLVGACFSRKAIVWLVAIAIMATAGEANAQWRTKTYHAQQYRTTSGTKAEATVNIQNITPNDPGWKTELLRVLNAEKNRAAAAQKQAEENAAYLQALGALGYQGGYQSASVAQSSAYGGNSIYGYSYSTVADYWNAADRNVLANQASNITNRAIDLAERWGDNQRSLYANEIEAQTRAVEALSGRELANAVMEGAAKVAEASKQSRSTITTTQQTIGGPPPIPQQAQGQHAQPNIAAVKSRCAKCHSGETPKHGLSLDGSVPLSFDQYDAARLSIDNGTMPPPDSGVILSESDQAEVVQDLRRLLIP